MAAAVAEAPTTSTGVDSGSGGNSGGSGGNSSGSVRPVLVLVPACSYLCVPSCVPICESKPMHATSSIPSTAQHSHERQPGVV
ncbi:hypothetical protein HaLaN_11892 [Haematococcus lacustris]|uniref:Uncharacterized protein n=1 Tax=Haematococcus lacustris TaxID=44745 RepID=A0A699Z272_HAELA|nr:hypothetical protein HaLaN_11892 [Haematococcus lacustris]